jgi:hypothetical protein
MHRRERSRNGKRRVSKEGSYTSFFLGYWYTEYGKKRANNGHAFCLPKNWSRPITGNGQAELFLVLQARLI